MLIKTAYNKLRQCLPKIETTTLVGQYKGNTITVENTIIDGKTTDRLFTISGKDFMKHIPKPAHAGKKLDKQA